MKKYRVSVNGNTYEVEVEQLESGERSIGEISEVSKPQVSENTIEINSPMPGNILRIETSEGSRVKSGDTLMILEALKMENEIVAPEDGVVSKIIAQEGSAVETGELLLILN